MYEVVFSKKAKETFDLIQAQLLARWGDHIVVRFEQRTMEVIKFLSDSPFVTNQLKAIRRLREWLSIKIVRCFTK